MEFVYKPNYSITDELLNKIAGIEKIRATVDSSRILPAREIDMRYRATVEATHSSTSIEGNPFNAKQVEKILATKTPLTRHLYAEIEVRNYKKALDFIEKRKSTGEKLTANDILKIHKIVADGLLDDDKKVGAWRWNPVFIENEKAEIVYRGATAKNISREIEQLLIWLNNKSYKIHPVVASAILHFQFVSIHPFADGNGRTARLLMALYLGLRDYDFRDSLVLDSFYAANKREYYDALNLADNYEKRKIVNLNPWIDYFAEGFLSSARVLAAEVLILSNFKPAKIPAKIGADDADLLSYAKRFGSISSAEAAEILPNANKRTIQRKLKQLVDDGYFIVEGNARNTRYKLKK